MVHKNESVNFSTEFSNLLIVPGKPLHFSRLKIRQPIIKKLSYTATMWSMEQEWP